LKREGETKISNKKKEIKPKKIKKKAKQQEEDHAGGADKKVGEVCPSTKKFLVYHSTLHAASKGPDPQPNPALAQISFVKFMLSQPPPPCLRIPKMVADSGSPLIFQATIFKNPLPLRR